MVIWNGDEAKGNAQGWGDCDQKPKCKVTVSVAEREGVDGSVALAIHGEGGGWLGGGWNWFGWWPENGGTDISQFDDLSFMIRVVAKEKALLPEPSGLTLALRSSNGKRTSPSTAIARRAKGLTDGKWHKVVIPLTEFRKGKEGKRFDMKTVWELNFSAWHETSRDFQVFLDEISVEKR
jgi:hypothetical protein